jgi:hypothetical protein
VTLAKVHAALSPTKHTLHAFVLFLAGCGSVPLMPEPAEAHPASTGAEEAPAPKRSDVLRLTPDGPISPLGEEASRPTPSHGGRGG